MLVTKQLLVAVHLHSMEKKKKYYVNGKINREQWSTGIRSGFAFTHSSKYRILCSEGRNTYRFGTIRGWVNDDKIVKS